MALEDIFRALEEQADKDVEAVLAEARAHAAVILDEAQHEANAARDNRVAEAVRSARSRTGQSLNAARLEARKRIAGVKERAVREVFEAAANELGQVRGRPEYDQVFRALADEALAGVEGEFEILVDPTDVDLARAYIAEKGLAAEVRPELTTSGGLVVSTRGGSVLRRNTLEDRMDKLRGVAQADVAEIVFA